MLIAVIALAWLLFSTWITVAVVGFDEKYKGSEWAGVIISCLFSPLMVFAIQSIIRKYIEKRVRNKKGGAE